MMAFGLLDSGASIKTFNDILTGIGDKIKGKVNFAINLLPWSVSGSILRIVSDELVLLWEYGELVAVANTLEASGVQLDKAVEGFGIAREGQKKSTALATLEGEIGVFIPSGRIVTNLTNSNTWTTLEDATLIDVGGFGKAIGVKVKSVLYGEVSATVADVWDIETPIFNWNSFALDEDAKKGRLTETDSELRTRARDTRNKAGSASLEAIVARVREVSNVTNVTGKENDTPFIDSFLRPGHSFEIYAQNGADQDIADTIWLHKPAGNRAHGTILSNVIATWGSTFQVKHSRPTDTVVWVEITGTKDGTYSGDNSVKSATLDYTSDLGMGDNVLYLQIVSNIVENTTGVLTMTVALGLSNGGEVPNTNQTITDIQLSKIDSANIDVTIV